MKRAFTIGCLLACAASPAAADQACKTQVDAAFSKLRDQKAFRLETTITNANGKLKLQADYILPDRMHQKVVLGEEGNPMEMIVIGKSAWSNQGQGWSALPEKFAEEVAKQVKETVAQGASSVSDYECLGDIDLEGQTYAGFKGILPTPIDPTNEKRGPVISAAKVPNQQSVYIDKATGLPIRNIVNPVTEPDKRLFDGRFSIVEGLKIEAPQVKAN